jgi:hypothetical protein
MLGLDRVPSQRPCSMALEILAPVYRVIQSSSVVSLPDQCGLGCRTGHGNPLGSSIRLDSFHEIGGLHGLSLIYIRSCDPRGFLFWALPTGCIIPYYRLKGCDQYVVM